jgi:hypothetical protein
MNATIQDIAATLDTAAHVEAGYGLRDACRLAIADDDAMISAFADEAIAHGDDVGAMRARDALRERQGQGPAGKRWEVAGWILSARLSALD